MTRIVRPYYPATGAEHNAPIRGVYHVPASPCMVTRPNKLAAGMYATYERRKRYRSGGSNRIDLDGDTLKLAVLGTLDPLAGRAYGYTVDRVKCPCCGAQTDRVKLSEKGGAVRRAAIRKLRKFRPHLP